jgi:hypothetical protein
MGDGARAVDAITRRGFLKTSGAGVVGAALLASPARALAAIGRGPAQLAVPLDHDWLFGGSAAPARRCRASTTRASRGSRCRTPTPASRGTRSGRPTSSASTSAIARRTSTSRSTGGTGAGARRRADSHVPAALGHPGGARARRARPDKRRGTGYTPRHSADSRSRPHTGPPATYGHRPRTGSVSAERPAQGSGPPCAILGGRTFPLVERRVPSLCSPS